MTDEDLKADLRLLETTPDPIARNAAALRLADRKAPAAKDALVRLIQRDDLRDHRGTLVHSLGYFDCADQFGLLVELVITGNFEVAHEALEILELVDDVPGDQADAGFEAVKAAVSLEMTDDWRRELLHELLEMFD